MTVRFNGDIVGELRRRAIDHNKAHPGAPVRLHKLKGLYKRWHNGAEPHRHALEQIDAFLTVAAEQGLEKAEDRFDPTRHPRGDRGRFSRGGGRSPPRSPPPAPPNSSPGGPPNRRDDALLQAAGTQVIPETRYTALGVPIAGAAGALAGAVTGATASFRHGAIDRAQMRIARRAGEGIGTLAGHTVSALGVHAPITGARMAAAGINRIAGTAIRGPSATAGDRVSRAIVRGAKAAGGKIGEQAQHISARVTTAPAAAARGTTASYLKARLPAHITAFPTPTGTGRIARTLARANARMGPVLPKILASGGGRIVGAAAGAVFPGLLLWAPAAQHVQEKLGPIEDALFPRRVKKFAGVDLEDVNAIALEKQLTRDELMKASALSTAMAVTRIAARRLSRQPGRIARLVARHLTPSRIPTSPTPRGAAQVSAHQVFTSHEKLVPGRFSPAGRILPVAQHIAALGAGGAGVGAISGFAAATFNQKHPRDKEGRFTTKARQKSTIRGALTGAAIGAGLGLATGLAASRGGQRHLLQASLARLRGATEVNGSKLPEFMHGEAKRLAGLAHTDAFMRAHPAEFQGFRGSAAPDTVEERLILNAFDRWKNTVGEELKGGVRSWYRLHLERGFEAQVKREMSRLPTRSDRVLPGLDGTPIPLSGKRGSTVNLLGRVDESKLSDQQRKLWDGLKQRYTSTRDEIEGIYTHRKAEVDSISTELATAEKELSRLETNIDRVPRRWNAMRDAESTTVEQLRDFSKASLGHTLKARGKESALKEIEERVPIWLEEADQAKSLLEAKTGTGPTSLLGALKEAREAETAPLGHEHVKNPFGATEKDRFLPAPPPNIDTVEGIRAAGNAAARQDPTVKRFLKGLEDHEKGASEHLNSLIAAREADIVANTPTSGLATRAFHHVAPKLAATMMQGQRDAEAIMGAHRESLTGAVRHIYDFAHQNNNPSAALDTVINLGGHAASKAAMVRDKILRHWKSIVAATGIASTFGAIDLSQPWGQNVQINPKKWRHPRDLSIVAEQPDVFNKPHQGLFGVSYKTPSGETRFLQGIHILDDQGHHVNLPFGTDVDQARRHIRGNTAGAAGDRSRFRTPGRSSKSSRPSRTISRRWGQMASPSNSAPGRKARRKAARFATRSGTRP